MSLIKRIENGTTTYIDAVAVRAYVWISIGCGFILGIIVGVSVK